MVISFSYNYLVDVSVIALTSTLWSPTRDEESFAPVHVLQISSSVLGATVIASLIYYILLVVKYNRKKLLPDSASFGSPPTLDGASPARSSQKRVLDDQAEYIRHLLDQNRSLNKRLRDGGVPPAEPNPSDLGPKERLPSVDSARSSLESSSLSGSDSVMYTTEGSQAEIRRLTELLGMERTAASSFQDIIAKQRNEIERLQSLRDSDAE